MNEIIEILENSSNVKTVTYDNINKHWILTYINRDAVDIVSTDELIKCLHREFIE